ncbi:hypothetical protein PR048_012400 [Dryococelus australis]|uniref:Uncharacterized protein n=1 Tax=Dryococelus australis TaxID=614101 RepID=A0ABQ9HQ34_9NEOP|nr:hypothetical protein PR048_012400 [Dryococelus australis]
MHVIRLFADGCGGQNKKLNNDLYSDVLAEQVISTQCEGNHTNIPSTWTLFLNPRRIEIELKHRDTYVKPEEYLEIFANYGKVLKLFDDCPVFDWKKISQENIKKATEIAFQVFQFQEIHYFLRPETRCSSSLIGIGAPVKNVKLTGIGVPVKEVKIADMRKLLTLHFGDGWEGIADLMFYTVTY